jgi:hypothetical protein
MAAKMRDEVIHYSQTEEISCYFTTMRKVTP